MVEIKEKFLLQTNSILSSVLVLFIQLLANLLVMMEPKNNNIEMKSKVRIGDRIILEDLEWKVAEIKDEIVTLYREGVGGNSHTIKKSLMDIESILVQQTDFS